MLFMEWDIVSLSSAYFNPSLFTLCESFEIASLADVRRSKPSTLNCFFLPISLLPSSASGHYIVAFVFSLLVASSVSTVYYSLAANYPPKGLADQLWVHLPFSLWHSYSIITAFISAFALFTPERHHVGFTLKVITMITLGLLATTGYGYAFQSRRGDVAGAAVIALYLYGVFER